jgi:hypothetical protein
MATGRASTSMMNAANWDKTSQDIPQVLNAASGSDDHLDRVEDPEAQNIEPPLYIDSLNKVSSYPIPRHAYTNSLQGLYVPEVAIA